MARELIRGDLHLRAMSLRRDVDLPTILLARRMHGRIRAFLNVEEEGRLLWVFAVDQTSFTAAEAWIEMMIEPDPDKTGPEGGDLHTTFAAPPFLRNPGGSRAVEFELADGRAMRVDRDEDGWLRGEVDNDRKWFDDWPKHWIAPLLHTIMRWDPDRTPHTPVPVRETGIERLQHVLAQLRQAYTDTTNLVNAPASDKPTASLERPLSRLNPAFAGPYHLAALDARIHIWLDEHGRPVGGPDSESDREFRLDFTTALLNPAERPELRIQPYEPDILREGELYQQTLDNLREEKWVSVLCNAHDEGTSSDIPKDEIRAMLEKGAASPDRAVFLPVGAIWQLIGKTDKAALLLLRDTSGPQPKALLYHLRLKEYEAKKAADSRAALLLDSTLGESGPNIDTIVGWKPVEDYVRFFLNRMLAWQQALVHGGKT